MLELFLKWMGLLSCTLIARVGCLCPGCFFPSSPLLLVFSPTALVFQNPDFLWISFSTVNIPFSVCICKCFSIRPSNNPALQNHPTLPPVIPAMSNSWAFPGFCKGKNNYTLSIHLSQV